MTALSAEPQILAVRPVRATLSACCAILLGLGVGRFAYTPLIPALIAEHWFTPGGAAFLGAMNLAGYLAGALAGRRLVTRWDTPRVLRVMMILVTFSFFACAVRLGFPWFCGWRLIAGFGGGVVMVVAAPSVLPFIPPSRRGLAGGAIFTGVGLGIVMSGTLVPELMRWGLPETWRGLGGLSVALTVIAWSGWPSASLDRPSSRTGFASPGALRSLYLQYGLNAAGLVPHMIFLADYIARGLGEGLVAGSRHWMLLGAGALVGPVVLGRVGDRIGFARAVRYAYPLQAAFVALLLVAGPVAPVLSSFMVGAFLPGITTLALGRVRELAAGDMAHQTAAWGVATIAFSIGQVVAGYGYSYVIRQSDDYAAVFLLGAGALLLAFIINLLPISGTPMPPSHTGQSEE